MSDWERRQTDDQDPVDMEAETRRLMEEAMSKSSAPVGTTPEESKVTEEVESEENTSTASSIDDTFQRIQIRMDDLLATIEDTARGAGPDFGEQMQSVLENLEKRLKMAGLGIFTTIATKIVKDELHRGINTDRLMEPVYDSVADSRARVEDIIDKATRGTVKSVGRSAGNLQARLVQMYAKVGDLEQQLETTRAELVQWRSRAKELEDLVHLRDETITSFEERLVGVQEAMNHQKAQIAERDESLSVLKGEIRQAEAHIEQLQNWIDKLDTADELVSDYEVKLKEISTIQGQLAEQSEMVAQRDATIKSLTTDVRRLTEANDDYNIRLQKISEETSAARGMKDSLEAEISSLKRQLAELKARWDTLYQVAEDEPAFKAYFLVAGRDQTWMPLTHLSSAMGIPTVALKRQLQKFVDAGLVELQGDNIRPRKLSEVSKQAEAMDEQILEEAKAELAMHPEEVDTSEEDERTDNND